MKWNALLSVVCLILCADVLVASTPNDIENLSQRCANGNEKACVRLRAAVGKLTDQTELAKIAAEDKDWQVRIAAVGRLTDQALLAKTILGLKDIGEWEVRNRAIENLTDQAELTRVAIESGPWPNKDVLFGKLTSQAQLSRVAVEAKNWTYRLEAVQELTDQPVLTKIALTEIAPGDVDGSVLRLEAVKRLTDQAALAELALRERDSQIRSSAIGRLTDQAALARVAVEDKDRNNRITAIIAMDGSNPALKRLAFDDGTNHGFGYDTEESIARINLAVHEPAIQKRFPGATVSASASFSHCNYQAEQGDQQVEVRAESAIVALEQAGKPLAQKEWSTYCPARTSSPAQVYSEKLVHIELLLAELLRSPAFTQEDFAALSSSSIPELRLAVVPNLTDQTLIARIAIEDDYPIVREAAVRQLTDQTLLGRIARGEEISSVRLAAIEKLTDPVLLEKIAVEDGDFLNRSEATRRLDHLPKDFR